MIMIVGFFAILFLYFVLNCTYFIYHNYLDFKFLFKFYLTSVLFSIYEVQYIFNI